MVLLASGEVPGGASSSREGALIVDMLLGEPVTMDEMLEDLSKARIVYLGEVHSIKRHHELQLEIFRRMSDGTGPGLGPRGMRPALGMEMFTREQQDALDRWLAGKADLGALIRDLGGEHWTNIRDYEEVLLTARDRKVRILGLNAPDRLVKRVARVGLAGLSPEELAQIPPDTDQISPQLDRLLRLRLRVHKAFEKRSLDSIVLAQAVRDATMARSISRYLDSEAGRDRTVVVIAGAGHVNYGLGIPERVLRTHKLPYRIVIPTESGELRLSEEEKRQSLPLDMVTHMDLRFLRAPIADYLHVIPRKEENEPAAPNEPESDGLTMLH